MNIKYFSVALLAMVSLAMNASGQISEPAIEVPAPEPAKEATPPAIIEKMPIPPVAEEPAPPMIGEGAKVSEPGMEPVVPVPILNSTTIEREVEVEMSEPEPKTEPQVEPEPEMEPEPEKKTGSSDYEDTSAPRSSPGSSKSVVEPASSSKGVVDEVEVTLEKPLGLTLSAGYMSKYVFYGADFGDNGIWTGLDYTLTEGPVPIDIGLWYINVLDPNEHGPDDELDLYLSVGGPSVLGFDTNLIYTAFFYPEGTWGAAHELAAGFGRTLFGLADWQTSAHYDFDLGGWYMETALSRKISLTDKFGLSLSSGVSYQIDYNEIDGRWNHFFMMATLPITLRSNVVLEPYLGYVVTLDGLRYMDRNFLHGGVSLSVSF